MNTLVDITVRKQAEKQQRLLLKEMDPASRTYLQSPTAWSPQRALGEHTERDVSGGARPIAALRGPCADLPRSRNRRWSSV